MEYTLKIKAKDYAPQQQMLIDLWEKHLKSVADGFNIGFITFVNKRPKNPKTGNRKIAGIKAECISYLNDDRELIKMSEENFLYLMAKAGIEIEVGGDAACPQPEK